MKVTIYETVKTKKEIELKLPFYRQHDVGGDHHSSVIYTKIDENSKGGLCNHSVQISDDSIEIEIIDNYAFDSSDSDYNLGKGLYKCSEEEYLEAVEQAKTMLKRF